MGQRHQRCWQERMPPPWTPRRCWRSHQCLWSWWALSGSGTTRLSDGAHGNKATLGTSTGTQSGLPRSPPPPHPPRVEGDFAIWGQAATAPKQSRPSVPSDVKEKVFDSPGAPTTAKAPWQPAPCRACSAAGLSCVFGFRGWLLGAGVAGLGVPFAGRWVPVLRFPFPSPKRCPFGEPSPRGRAGTMERFRHMEPFRKIAPWYLCGD